jgi:hypothetical protein
MADIAAERKRLFCDNVSFISARWMVRRLAFKRINVGLAVPYI